MAAAVPLARTVRTLAVRGTITLPVVVSSLRLVALLPLLRALRSPAGCRWLPPRSRELPCLPLLLAPMCAAGGREATPAGYSSFRFVGSERRGRAAATAARCFRFWCACAVVRVRLG